jgi:hypothetical protein
MSSFQRPFGARNAVHATQAAFFEALAQFYQQIESLSEDAPDETRVSARRSENERVGASFCARAKRKRSKNLLAIVVWREASGSLSRTRSPITSRSNWANDSRTLSVSLPMLELVLKDCVTDTHSAAVCLSPRVATFSTTAIVI